MTEDAKPNTEPATPEAAPSDASALAVVENCCSHDPDDSIEAKGGHCQECIDSPLLKDVQAYGDARAREERLRCAKLVCSWCRIGIPITADPEFGRLDAIYHLEGEGPASAAILCRAMELHILEPGDAD